LGYEVEDPTAALTGKLDMINARLGKIRQAMGKFGELETLAGAAADLELERVKLIKEIDTARQTVPASSVLNELKISIDLFFINPPYLESKGGIIETLANTPTDKIKETRQRLQQKIRQLIDGIYMTVEVQPKGNIRTASVAIKFKGQKAFMQEIDITTVNGKLDGWAIVNKRTVPSKTRKTA
jgi:hypothetical protein